MRITSVITDKGGATKTTTTHALATGINLHKSKKYKALALDHEPSGHLSYVYGADLDSSPTMYHVFNEEISIKEAIQETRQGDIIIGNDWMKRIVSLYPGDLYMEGVRKLKEELMKLTDYTHVIIDNQPVTGGILTTQSLLAADDIIIPMQAEGFSMKSLAILERAIYSARNSFNPNLKIAGILLTRFGRTNIEKAVKKNIEKWAELQDTKIFNVHIREGVCIKEAQGHKESIYEYAPNGKPVKDYIDFVEEYLNMEK